LSLASIVVSMAVNALATGLIVSKILTVFLEVKTTSVERTLGTSGGTKLRSIVFIIIESGMALLATQVLRIVIVFLPPSLPINIPDFVIAINQMFNGIAPTIILVRGSMKLSFEDDESFKEAVGSLRFDNPPSDPNISSWQLGVGSSSSMPLQDQDWERNEDDICLNNPPAGNLNTMGSNSTGSSMPPQERSEDTSIEMVRRSHSSL